VKEPGVLEVLVRVAVVVVVVMGMVVVVHETSSLRVDPQL
jgi:hypothetical protein